MEPTIVVDATPESMIIHWLVLEKECPISIVGPPPLADRMVRAPYYEDGEVLLYDHQTLVQFLQERYPGEQLLPIDPILRAQIRQACTLVSEPDVNMLGEVVTILNLGNKYMAGDQFTLLDIYVGTWLFEHVADHDISQAVYLDNYWKRISSRSAFRIAAS